MGLGFGVTWSWSLQSKASLICSKALGKREQVQARIKEAFLLTWRDPVGRVFLVSLGVISVPYLLPVFSADFVGGLWGDLARLFLIGITIFALRFGLKAIVSRSERQFWNLLTIAYGFWWAAKWIEVIGPDKSGSPAVRLIVDALFIAFYLALLIAADIRPDRGRGPERTRPEQALTYAGTVVLVAGLFAYFIALPAWADPEGYAKSLLALHYSIALNVILAARLIYLQGVTLSRRWCHIFGYLGLTALLWTGLDTLGLLKGMGVVEWSPGSVAELLWYTEAIPIFFIARLRHSDWLGDTTPAPNYLSDGEEETRRPALGYLVTYAFAFPVIHFADSAMGFLDPSLRTGRDAVVLAVLLLLGALVMLDRIAAERATGVLREQRRVAERALRDGEERYRHLFENSGDLIQSISADGKFEYVNPQWVRVLGYSEQEAYGLDFLEAVHPDERDHCRAVFESLQRGEGTQSVETVFLGKDGRKVFLSGSVAPVMADGRFVCTRGIFRDVTEQRMAEQEVARAREFAEHLLGLSPSVIYTCKAEGDFPATFISGNIKEQLGYSVEEFLSTPKFWASNIHPEDAPRVFENIPALFEQGRHVHEYRFRHKDGGWRWMHDELRLVRNSDGTPREIVGSWTDITSLKETEERVRLLNARLERLVTERTDELHTTQFRFDTLAYASPVGIFYTDAEGNCTHVNDQWCEMSGLTREESMGSGWSQAVHPDDRGRIFDEWYAGAAQGGEVKFEGRLLQLSGRVIWFYLHAVPQKDSEGNPAGYIGIVSDMTERKQAEEALQTSEEKFRVLAETLDASILIHQGDHFRYANPAAAKLTGYTRDELLEMRFWDLIHPDSQDEVRERGLARQRGEQVRIRREFKIMTKSGEDRWVDAMGGTMMFEGKPGGIVVGFDVTDRRAGEEVLRRRESRLRRQTEALTELSVRRSGDEGKIESALKRIVEVAARTLEVERVGVWLFDDSRSSVRSAALYELSQDRHSSGQELATRDYPGYFSLAERERTIAAEDARNDPRTCEFAAPYFNPLDIHSVLDAPIRVGGKTVGVVWHEHTGGQRKWTLDEKQFAGSVGDIVALMLEGKGKRQASLALERSEARLMEAQRIARMGSWEWCIATDSLVWSDEVFRIFGISPREFSGTVETFFAAVHPDDRKKVQRAADAALAGREPFQIDHRIVLSTGAIRVVREQAEVMFDDDGEAVRMIGTVQDITERVELEEQFQQSQKMELVGRLAGGVAHDFNNLLMIIRGHTELLMSTVGPESDAYRDAMEIQRTSDRAATLTQQLLAFSRKQILSPKPANLNFVIRDMTQMLERLIGEDITLTSEFGDSLHSVHLDSGRFQQVLMNLAVNARDAMPRGGDLKIATVNLVITNDETADHPGVPRGEYVLLTVADSGVGMPPEVLARIFEPFYTTKVDVGTGLGLSTVYGIVKQSAGHIRVDSGPGEGTTFRIYLPKAAEDAVPEEAGVAAAPVAGGSETVLLVEDEIGLRRITREFLQAQGYTVLEAHDGAEAVDVLARRGGRIDLLLTDVVMPRMSGRELADHVAETNPDAKIIFMTGYADDALEPYGRLGEDSVVLQKPFPLEGLVRKVREVLDA